MQATLNNRHKIAIILLSLLINLLLIFPLILMKLDLTSQDTFMIFQQEPEVDQSQDDAQAIFQEPEELIEHILSSGAIPIQNDQEIQRDMEEQPNPMASQATPGAQIDQAIEQESLSEQEEIQKEQEKKIDQVPKEKLEIVISAAPPHFLNFAGGFPRCQPPTTVDF